MSICIWLTLSLYCCDQTTVRMLVLNFWLLNATLSPLPSILSVSEVARWSFRSVTRVVIRKEGWGTDPMTYLRCQTVSFTTYLILDRSTLLLLAREWMCYSETWEFQTVLHILHIKKTHHEIFIFCEMQSNCYNKKNTHQIYTFLLRWIIIIIIHVNDCSLVLHIQAFGLNQIISGIIYR